MPYSPPTKQCIQTFQTIASISPDSDECADQVSSQSIQASAYIEGGDNGTKRAPLVRNNSSETVKPALRRPSVSEGESSPPLPSPTKNVQFDLGLNEERYFFRRDHPARVSAEGTPTKEYASAQEYPFDFVAGDAWKIRTSNLSAEPQRASYSSSPVRLKRLLLSKDGLSLTGSIVVADITFQKSVTVRYTFDHWRTISELSADYDWSNRVNDNESYDHFRFSIELPDQAHVNDKTFCACIRYRVAGQEYWDNNGGNDYMVTLGRQETAASLN